MEKTWGVGHVLIGIMVPLEEDDIGTHDRTRDVYAMA
jgi:hypothetical protein